MIPLKIAVVGAGAMGSNHIRICKDLPELELVAVVDQDLDRARTLAGSSGAKSFRSVDEIDLDVEAAVVAVPTMFHVPVAKTLAPRGIHMLIEKPLAPSAVEALELVALAEQHSIVLAVGHVERFNAAVVELPGFIDSPVHFSASRISPYTPRISDGVIFDLMIHDLDIVSSLLGVSAEVVEISGIAKNVRSSSEDIATVNIRFSSGETATFHTSRIGQEKVRSLVVNQLDNTLTVDLLRQGLTINQMKHHEYVSTEGTPLYRQTNVSETPFIQSRGEPLALELLDFASAVTGGKQPRVDGKDGARAVEFAQRALSAVSVF